MKKLLSTLLLAALLMTTAACAADTSVDDDAVATDTKDALESTTADETVPPEYIAPEGVDYGGLTFTVAANSWSSSSWVLAKYCEISAEEENGDPINDAVYQRNRIVEEELNVKLGLFTIPKMASTTEMLTSIMAGDSEFHFASPNGASLPKLLVGQDIFVNLSDITTLDIDASWWDQNSADEFSIYGKHYAVTGDFNFYSNGAPICNFFSKKLVNDLQLDNPYDIVRNGEWTLDVMFEYAEATARDVNGDGQMTHWEDNWGVFSEGPSLVQFVRSCGQRLSSRDADGDIEFVVNTEKTVDIVQRAIPFLRDKNINIFAGDNNGQYNSIYTDLFLPKFIDNGAMFYCNQLLVALNLRTMEADFGILPMPKYDEAQSDYISTLNTSWSTYSFVPVTCADLDMTGNVMNALGYYSQQLITPAFIEQTVMSKTLRDEESAEIVQLLFDKQDHDIATFFNWGAVNTTFSSLLGTNNVNYASEYARLEEKLYAELESTMEQLRGN